MDRTRRHLVLALSSLVVGASAPRGSRSLTFDDAMKELDLIRPSRQKLAEDFALSTPHGRTFKLSEQRGKIVFVNFWATWCPPCREEMPAMEKLWLHYRERGFVVVAISVDRDPIVVPPFIKQGKFTFPVALDPKMQAATAYGVRALPSSFLVDRQGYLTALALGPRMWDGEAAFTVIEGMIR